MTLRAKVLSACVSALILATAAAVAASAAPSWVAAWHFPAFPPTAVLVPNDIRVFGNQTVRQVLRIGTGGERVRVRLTNELGLAPVEFGSVRIALSSPYGVTEPETDRQLSFDGRSGATIPAGKAVLSDPIDFKVSAFATVAVSVYYPHRIAPAAHLSQVRVSKKGDHGAVDVWPGATMGRAPAIVSSIEIESSTPKRVLVAFGDSITEGAGATPGANLAWPEQLALRLAANRDTQDWIVINSGISGNRLLHEGAGPRALDRFDRDVLEIPGVAAVLFVEGINDIGWAFDPEGDTGPVTAEDIIAVYKEFISRAHARGVKVYGGTLTPYEGATYFTPAGEAVRTAVNQWIRNSRDLDGFVDFDAATRDPKSPSKFKRAYQSGDNLHPGDAGYRAMADAVDLKLFATRH
jgi:lysophospholipase L1-like esterase